MINESLDHVKITATIILVCLVIAAVFYFYYPVREATTNHLDGVVDMQRSEALSTVYFIDGQVISGAEAKQFCIRYRNSNIAIVPAPGSITDLRGRYSVSINFNTEPVTMVFTPVVPANLY